MVHSLYGLGEKRLSEVKSLSGTMLWRCTDGRLTEAGIQFTAVDTLAICNMLHDNYDEIVKHAREELRSFEEERNVAGFKAKIPYR